MVENDIAPTESRRAVLLGRVDPPRRSWFRAGLGLGAGLLVAYGAAQAIVASTQVLTLVLLSLFLAVSLEPVVSTLMRMRLNRGMAVAVVLVVFAALLAGFVALVIPPVTTEVNALTRAIPKWLQQLHDHNSQLGRLEDRYHVVEKAQEKFATGSAASGLASGFLVAGQLILGAVTALFLVVTLTIYFLLGLPAIKAFSLRFVRVEGRARVERIIDEILVGVGRYMLANVATSALAGLATFVWCWELNVPYSALLGFFVAIMDLVPMIGSTVGGVVVSLVALAVSLPVAVATAIFYVVFRFTEDHLITPLTMKFTVRIHPVATIIAVLIGATLLGLIGALVAVPAATAIGLILDETVFPARERQIV